MKQLKNVFRILTLLFTALFIASCDGNGGDNKDSGTSGDSIVCTYYMKDDTSVYYVFYGDKTAEYHANGKIANTRSELIYSGNPLKAGTVSLKISLTGTELISFNVKESNGTLIPTVELVPGFPVEYTLTLDGENDNEENSGTETPEEPSTDIDESPLMFMGFDNVVTIEKGTDITGITNTIYSLTSDTTLKFKGGINSITLTTIAAAMGTNDSVKIALDFSEATGITEWTNKLAGQKTLYAISLPSTVTSVQDEAFMGCTNLKAITVPKTITEFPSVDSEIIVNYPGTLADWLNGTLVLPKESTLYLNGKELSDEVTIPASVTAIRSEAFKYCSKITNIIIPDGITSIDENAFAECGEITVTMLGSFSAIGAKSFAGCTIHNVVIGEGVTYIPQEAFYGCTWLTNITIPEGVTEIGKFAFENCTELTTITIPKSIKSFGNQPFRNCERLNKVYYQGTLETWLNLQLNNMPLCYWEDEVIRFQDVDFYITGEIVTDVVIPDSVISLRPYAFSDLGRNLKTVTIPDSVIYIGSNSFDCCPNLTKIHYKGTLETWLNNVLDHGFSLNAKIFYINNEKVTEITDVVIPDSVETIRDCAFYGWENLKTIKVPTTVNSIGDYAFGACSSLTSITIPNSVTSIGCGAFRGCSSLTSITIPDGVTSIEESTFWYCKKLQNVTLPNTVTTIGYGAFGYCSSISSIIIPNSVTYIGNYAFTNCDSLTSITIPAGVIRIEVQSFYRCSSLASITIPVSVTDIGDSAFYQCDNLTTINYRGTEEQWNAINIGSDNTPLTTATIVYNYTGD